MILKWTFLFIVKAIDVPPVFVLSKALIEDLKQGRRFGMHLHFVFDCFHYFGFNHICKEKADACVLVLQLQ